MTPAPVVEWVPMRPLLDHVVFDGEGEPGFDRAEAWRCALAESWRVAPADISIGFAMLIDGRFPIVCPLLRVQWP